MTASLRYCLDLREPHSHRLTVAISHRPQRPLLRLQLPAWTPGSYLERDYVRHLEGLKACQRGQSLPLRRLDRHSWQLAVTPGQELEISYGLMAVEATVRTNWLDGSGGFLTAAAWALELEGCRWEPHGLELLVPEGWQVATALGAQGKGWLARNYDELIDAPISLGPLESLAFAVGGVPHQWVWQGLPQPAPLGRWREDLPRLCAAACGLMGVERPAAHNYLFMTRFVGEGYGGLEHNDCCALIFGRRELATPAGYQRLLQLVAHEYLHQWNVRRLRPRELSPYSYGGAVIVPTLWFAEGVTSYFDSLVVYRAGLCSKEELLAEWAEQISRYLTTPGRRVQSLRESSEEAWVKLYRRDAHSDNQQVSYYLKGQLLALLIDLHLRTHGASLEQLLQQLWRNFGSTGRGYSTEDLFDAIGGLDPQLAQLCEGWLASTAELPLASYLQTVGLLLTAQASDLASTGLQLELVGRELRVRRVDRHSPAEQAGLAPADELLALDGERLRSCDQWEQGLSAEGEHQLLFCRDGLVRTSVLRPAAPQPRHWQLLPDPSAPAAAAQLRSQWLGLPQS